MAIEEGSAVRVVLDCPYKGAWGFVVEIEMRAAPDERYAVDLGTANPGDQMTPVVFAVEDLEDLGFKKGD